jgi:hypothetical protein
MAIWTVWEHEKFDPERRIEKAVFVRDGFSWLAFLVPPLWLLASGMIVVLVLFLAVAIGLTVAVDALAGEQLAPIVPIALSLWFGFEARALRRWALSRRGWTMTAVVEGREFREAERRYVDARLEDARRPARAAAEPPRTAVPTAGPPAPAQTAAPWGAPSSGVLGVFPEGPR